MRIKIWGARGSLPSPLPPNQTKKKVIELISELEKSGSKTSKEILGALEALPVTLVGGFGGNTPCFEVSHGKSEVIIDGGSGIRLKGYELLQGPCGKGKGEVHIYFTHFHWDHLIGLPFFTPLFIPGNNIHFYAVQDDLESVIKTIFRKPYFPVELENLAAKIHYHRLEPRKPTKIGEIQMIPYQLDHPDPCWGYKIHDGSKNVAYCVDTECKRISAQELGPDLPLYQDIDVMIFDAQYTLMESIEKIDWGHAAASMGLDLAMREGVKKVLFMHHDPASSDKKIVEAENEARKYYDSQLKTAKRLGAKVHEVEWFFAHEGFELSV